VAEVKLGFVHAWAYNLEANKFLSKFGEHISELLYIPNFKFLFNNK